MSKYLQYEKAVTAIYTKAYTRFSEGNPLIEALPNFNNDNEVRKLLLNRIPYEEEERTLLATDRLAAIGGLFYCFYALPIHMDLAYKFAMALKSGYISRNPLLNVHNNAINQLSSCVRTKDSEFQTFKCTNATTAGFSLIGVSGMGKTSTMNRILQLYPQKILHENYHGESFNFLQIVWMKIECPYDGGVKGLCSNFFRNFDELTGDNTFAKFANYSKATIDSMIPQIALIARRHGLGALIIDEIQNVNIAKSGGKEKMLNFIKNLVNTIGVPVIVIGTPDSMNLLSGNLQDARRFSGQQGLTIMEPIPYENPVWNIFLKSIWKFQWTNIETPLTDNISYAIHKNSGGIIGEAIKLYAFVQQSAINRGREYDEIITSDLIENIANSESFYSEKQKIEQIYSKEQKVIEQFKEDKIYSTKQKLPINTKKNVSNEDVQFPVVTKDIESCIKLMEENGHNGEELLRKFGLLCQTRD